MKLPENKKERIQIFVLVGIGLSVLLYLGGSYAIKPLLNKRTERLDKIEALRDEIEMAERGARMVQASKTVNDETVSEILEISEASGYILKARLGNYLLGATEIIEAAARQARVELESVVASSTRDIPARENDPSPFRLYAARVNAACGVHDFVRMVQHLEEGNPFIAITKLSIQGEAARPGTHTTTFDVEWPIWRDEATLTAIKASAKQFKEDRP